MEDIIPNNFAFRKKYEGEYYFLTDGIVKELVFSENSEIDFNDLNGEMGLDIAFPELKGKGELSCGFPLPEKMILYSRARNLDTVNYSVYEVFYKVDDKGFPDGEFIKFNNGCRSISANYHNGKLYGRVTRFNNKNEIYQYANYIDGKKHGVHRIYYANGMVCAESFWKEGIKNGACRFYNEKGILTDQFYYKDGKKEGEWLQFDKYTGILLKKINYKNGVENGISYYFSAEGELEEQIWYVDGECVKANAFIKFNKD